MDRQRILLRAGLLLAALSLGLPRHAIAAEGVNLAWDHCLGQGTGVQNLAFACDTDAGSHVMTGSFVLAANLDQAVGLEIVVELAAASPALPAWWDLWAAGSCRPTSLAANLVPDPADPACLDWSLGAAQGGLAKYCTYGGPCFSGPPASPNQAKIIIGDAVAAENARDLTPGSEYFAFHVVIDNARTTGATGCGGCAVPVCIGLNSINVVGKDNIGSRLLTTPSMPGSNFIAWQGGAVPASRSVPGCPAVTAARHSTWGTVKSLYR
jgi:hypothetical protein